MVVREEHKDLIDLTKSKCFDFVGRVGADEPDTQPAISLSQPIFIFPLVKYELYRSMKLMAERVVYIPNNSPL